MDEQHSQSEPLPELLPEPSRQDAPHHAAGEPDRVTPAESNIESNLNENASPARLGWSRRRFMVGAAGGLAALLAACGRSRSTPTPTPTQTPLPSALPTVTPTQVGQSSLLSTDARYRTHFPLLHEEGADAVAMAETPTPAPPTATATPQPPPPTPTPEATPFPPGPPSKLGLFVARNLPEIFDLLATGGVKVIKTLELDANFVAQIRRTSPNTLIIGRMPDADLGQVTLAGLDPLPAARAYVERMLPIADDPARRPYFDAWEGYNEPVAGNADEMTRLADFEAERTRLLGERGIRSVIGNFGTGQPTSDPPFALWEQFLPAIQAAQQYDGWLGLHEYSAPTIYFRSTREDQGRYPGVSPEDTGWLTLRYRQVYNQILKPRGLAIPLVFTELGVDGLVDNRPGPPDARGWQHFQDYWREDGYGLWGPGAYVEQLVWFDAAMRQDDYVLGGCIFALAASSGWESYDIRGPVVGVLQQYLSVHSSA